MSRRVFAGLVLLFAALRADEPRDVEQRWEAFSTMGRALQDTRGHIWCMRVDHRFTEWDGTQWREHPAPPSELVFDCFDFVPDGRDRGWILPATNKPTAICDFATGKWQIFPSLHKALVAQLPKGVKFNIPTMPYLEYAFSGDGRIGAFSHNNEVDLYEKGRWRTWKLPDFAGDSNLAGTPFFAPDGKFSVPVYESTVWQWHSGAGKWRSAEGIAIPHPGMQADVEEPKLPEDFETTELGDGGAMPDRNGVTWFLRYGKSALYKYALGREVRLLEEGECSHFKQHWSINEVHVDGSGNALLDGGFSGDHPQVFIRARHPVPECSARLTNNEEDTARFTLGEGKGAAAWHTWRIDGSAWQKLDDRRELTLDGFLPGRHTLEVRAFNAELTPAPAIATLSFVTSPAAEAQFAARVRELADPGIAVRETAARKLKSQGLGALPRLRTARAASSPDVQWWIDAIIQHIERQKMR